MKIFLVHSLTILRFSILILCNSSSVSSLKSKRKIVGLYLLDDRDDDGNCKTSSFNYWLFLIIKISQVCFYLRWTLLFPECYWQSQNSYIITVGNTSANASVWMASSQPIIFIADYLISLETITSLALFVTDLSFCWFVDHK